MIVEKVKKVKNGFTGYVEIHVYQPRSSKKLYSVKSGIVRELWEDALTDANFLKRDLIDSANL
jgi:hypothetical protein